MLTRLGGTIVNVAFSCSNNERNKTAFTVIKEAVCFSIARITLCTARVVRQR